MKALDTNILVRFLVQDDEKQALVVNNLFMEAENQKKPFYISLLVILKLIWVLQSTYKVPRKNILASISALLSMPTLVCEHAAMLNSFIDSANNNNLDLSDLLIGYVGHNAKCETTLTFDKKAAKSVLFSAL